MPKFLAYYIGRVSVKGTKVIEASDEDAAYDVAETFCPSKIKWEKDSIEIDDCNLMGIEEIK